jgi:NitT/TauT family transport system ATP-binding protein
MEAVRLADSVLVMASEPGRIAHRIELAAPALVRDDAFVHRTTAELLQAPAVRACFGLEALPQATAACDGAVKVVDFGATQPRGKKGFSC